MRYNLPKVEQLPTDLELGLISTADAAEHRDALIINIKRPGIFGNPFTIKESGGKAKAVARYRSYLYDALFCEEPTEEQKNLRAALRSLVIACDHGARVRLVCACTSAPCHGVILVKAVQYFVGLARQNRAARAQAASTAKKQAA